MDILETLKGKKTYFVGAALIVLGVLGILQPDMVAMFGVTADNSPTIIGLGVTSITLRAGIKKAG